MTNLCHHTLFAFLVTGAMLGSVVGLRSRHTGSKDSGLVNVLAAKGRFAVAYEGITTTSSPCNSAKYMTSWIRSSPMSADRKLQEEVRRYLVSVIAGVTGDGICPDLDPTFRMTCSGGQAALVDQEDTNCNLEEGSSIVCSGQGRVIVDCIGSPGMFSQYTYFLSLGVQLDPPVDSFTCNLGGDDVVGQGIFVGSICPDFSADYGDIMCTPSTSTRVSGSDPLCLTTCGGGICTEQDLIPLRANVYLPSCEWEASEGIPSPPPTRAPSPLPTKAPTYTISDGSGGTDLGTATIVVPGVDNPLFVSSWNKLLAADGAASDSFGVSSVISGDIIIIGASGSGSGSVYVFARNCDSYAFGRSCDSWVEVSKLVPSDGGSGDRFGRSLAISGDTIVVGAPRDDEMGTWSGSAYVFVREGESWIERAKLVPSDGALSDHFGNSVAISGDNIVIGAYQDDDNGSWSGSAYVFAREGEAWMEVAKLLPSDGAPNYWFGLRVAISGDIIVIGSKKDKFNGSDSGSAYIFASEDGAWVERAKLVPSDGAAYSYFGSSVAVSGDTIVVGAEGGPSVIGSAYVFVREGVAWVEQAKLVPSDGAVEEFFGESAAISGNKVIVGAHWDNDNGFNSGSAYVFARECEAWVEQGKLIPSDSAAYDVFGQSVSISNDTVVIGAPMGNNDNGANSGSAYVVDLYSDTSNMLLAAESKSCKDVTDQVLCVVNGNCHWKFGKGKCVDLCQGRSNEYQCVNAGGGGKCIWNSTDVCSPTYPPKSSEIASAAPTSFYSALHVVSIMLLITLS